MYAIFDGTHYNGGCCFDYGNAETNSNDDGNGTMEAIYFGNIKVWGYGAGNGPWVMADLENGLFSGVNQHHNADDPPSTTVTPPPWSRAAPTSGRSAAATPSPAACPPSTTESPQRLRLQPDEQAGRDHPRHRRRQQQRRPGHLLRGRHDLRLPLDATENAVQANITGVRYGYGGPSTRNTGELHAVGAGKCLDVKDTSTTNGTQLAHLWTCNGGANQKWILG